MQIKDYIIDATKSFKFKLSDTQLSKLEAYYYLLIEWNQKMNLTAITDPQGVAVKHFADSLVVLDYVEIPQGARLVDVGTGAGFPGLVLKIARPDIELTLLDSLNKRLVFLNSVIDELGLSANLIHSRAEVGGQDIELRESFDFAVSRAVARLSVLSEYCIPYVRLGGRFLAFKSREVDDEIMLAKKAIGVLGGKIITTHRFCLPNDEGERAVVEIEKNSPTPDRYPRNSGKIKSNPL